MIDLNNKRILFFAPNFFGYDKEIRKKLQEYGALVDLYDERPSSGFFVKAIIRLNKKILSKYINRYFNKIIVTNQNKKYDFVFFIKGEVLTPSIIKKIKESFIGAKFILYLWDSIDNYKSIKETLFLFDKTFTFDLTDSRKIELLIFRPLFYIDGFKDIGQSKSQSFVYDLLFIGTVHSDRWNFLKKVREEAKKHNFKVYYYLYIQSPIIFIFRKIFDKKFRTIPTNDIKFFSIPKSEILSLTKNSKVIVDIQHPKQTGLTIRTFEVLGARRKMMTTNPDIKLYDFFNPNNIAILDRDNPHIESSFWDSEYYDIEEQLYYKYSIEGWLDDIFIF